MNTSVRHHYIPVMILKHFTDRNGFLHCYRKDSGNAFKSKPESVFYIKNLHTQRDSTGSKDSSVESNISKYIEGPAAPVVTKIIEAARNRTEPALTNPEKKIWDSFFCCQLRRVPKSRELLADSEIVLEALDDFEREVRPLTITERQEYENPELQKELTNNAWINAILPDNGELLDVVQSKGLAIGVIEISRKSFIMGDRPVTEIASEGSTDLRRPGVERLLPISYDVVVTPARLPGEEELIPINDARYIRKLNEVIFDQSSIVAGRSKTLIESLCCRR